MELINVEQYAAGRRRSVLIVESADRNRRFLTTLLKEFEYEPYAVSTAKDGLEAALLINPALIVISGQIDAECNAVGFIKEFKAANPECTASLVVLIAKADPAFEGECLRAGALTCLCAPVTFENFYRVIQMAIEAVPRMTIRISTNLPAAINGSRKDELVREISEGGAYVQASTLLPLDTKLSIRIKLPDSVISCDAVVIYVKRSDGNANGRSGMGLHFERISDEDQRRIRLFIRSEMSKDIMVMPSKNKWDHLSRPVLLGTCVQRHGLLSPFLRTSLFL